MVLASVPATSRSHLRFEARGGRTVLVASHSELPLQVQRPIQAPDGSATVTLLSPAGALFDGDRMRLEVDCGAGTNVALVTPAATKLNRCDHGQITFELDVTVADGARFAYVPYELIPLPGAVYAQRIHVRLAPTARATLLEVIGPGLLAQPFAYTRLTLHTEVCDETGWLALERQVLTPAARESMAGHSHYGGAFVFGPALDQAAADAAHATLDQAAGVRGSAALLPRGGIGLKALGTSAVELRAALLAAVAAAEVAAVQAAQCAGATTG